MKSSLKFSGIKREWPTQGSSSEEKWKFDQRPGGWIIAERATERVRFFLSESKNKFFFQVAQPGTLSQKGAQIFGEIIAKTYGSGSQDQASGYVAQFPGKIQKVLVKPGDKIQKGTNIMMVEAMKMEFAIKGQEDGIIKVICVKEGDILTPGQKLLELES